MNRGELLAAVVAERFGPAPVAERRRRPMPPPRRDTTNSGSGAPLSHSAAHDHEVPKINTAPRWECVGCRGPAHPGHGWRCPICRCSAYRTAPEVEREVADV